MPNRRPPRVGGPSIAFQKNFPLRLKERRFDHARAVQTHRPRIAGGGASPL